MAPIARIPALFICDDNTARSRMAAAFARTHGGVWAGATNAGFESNAADALARDVMREIGIDLPSAPEPHVFDRYLEGLHPLHVVRLVDNSIGERCPIFPGVAEQVEWDVPDPTRFAGTPEERRARFVELREQIRMQVEHWLDAVEAGEAA